MQCASKLIAKQLPPGGNLANTQPSPGLQSTGCPVTYSSKHWAKERTVWTRPNRSQRLKLALVTRCVAHSLSSQKLLQKKDPWTVPARFEEALGTLKPASVGFLKKKTPHIRYTDASYIPEHTWAMPAACTTTWHRWLHSVWFQAFYLAAWPNKKQNNSLNL